MLTKGFKNLNSSTEPFLDTTQTSAIKQACSLACSNEDKLTYCCKEYEIDDKKIQCGDERLGVGCGLRCERFSCYNNQSFDEIAIGTYPHPNSVQLTSALVNHYGEKIGRWADGNCLMITIDNEVIVRNYGNAGGCDSVGWSVTLEPILEQIIEDSSCNLDELDSKIKNLYYSTTEEQFSQNFDCLGTIEFFEVGWGPE